MSIQYWPTDNPKKSEQFDRQSNLMQALFDCQASGQESDGTLKPVDFSTLADRQRTSGFGCIYLAGSFIDHKFCLGSDNVGLLHSSLPTDDDKAIRPAFHQYHDELIVCTSGELLLEYSCPKSRESLIKYANAPVETAEDGFVIRAHLSAGDHVLIHRGWPHRIVLDRDFLDSTIKSGRLHAEPNGKLWASFLAVKMGQLGPKDDLEDMTTWKTKGLFHTLVKNWEVDDAFLKGLKAPARKLLRLPQYVV